MVLTSTSLVEAILEREAAETRDCTDINRMRLADLFGYVLIGADGSEIGRSNDPPSKWPPEILALVGR